jgi:hypothetical protein
MGEKMLLTPPLPPMEARSVEEIPAGYGWQYEPKWDGFRCIAFRDNEKIYLQSKAGQPLARYFPDVVDSLAWAPLFSSGRDSCVYNWLATAGIARFFCQHLIASSPCFVVVARFSLVSRSQEFQHR